MYHDFMYTYILKNDEGSLYVGITSRLNRRLLCHREGGCKSTSAGDRNWKLVHFWRFTSYMMASKLERFLHEQSSSVIETFIGKTLDQLPVGKIWGLPDSKLELTISRKNSGVFQCHTS